MKNQKIITKTLLSLLGVLCLLLPLSVWAQESSTKAANIEPPKWGSSPEEIIAREGEPEEASLYYLRMLQDIPIVIMYDFIDNQLRRLSYAPIADPVEQTDRETFFMLAALLTKKYGAPQKQAKDKLEKLIWAPPHTIIVLSFGERWALTFTAKEQD